MIIRLSQMVYIPHEIINDDAFLALETRRNGYLVTYEPNAKVIIDVPKTLMDYLIQRRRVLLGHRQILELTNYSPTNFRTLIKINPLSGMKLLIRTLIRPSLFVGMWGAIAIELLLETQNYASKLSSTQSDEEPYNPVWKRINKSHLPSVNLGE